VVSAVVDADLRGERSPAGRPTLHPHADPGRRRLHPRAVVAGHKNNNRPDDPAILAALTELHDLALARIGENTPLPNILDLGYLPACCAITPPRSYRTWSA